METQTAQHASHGSNLLDDVFGSDSDADHGLLTQQQQHQHQQHPSDVPRLQAQHHTSGYRDGIAAAKATSIQQGFDEGFSLGATIGQKVGRVLGVLEGIAEALLGRSPGGEGHQAQAACAEIETRPADSWEGRRRAAEEMLALAREELDIGRIFGPEFWAGDGTWRYPVGGEGGENGGGEVVFEDVAAAHPLVRKWTGIVDAEMRRWGVDGGILDAAADDGGAGGAGAGEEHKEAELSERRDGATAYSTVATGRSALDW